MLIAPFFGHFKIVEAQIRGQNYASVINQMERQVPKCRLCDSAGEAKRQAEQFGLNICPVVNEQDIVLGLLRNDAWEHDPTSLAEKLMESAPTTLRPYYPAKDAKELLDRKGGDGILVTSSNGKLMGVFKRARP